MLVLGRGSVLSEFDPNFFRVKQILAASSSDVKDFPVVMIDTFFLVDQTLGPDFFQYSLIGIFSFFSLVGNHSVTKHHFMGGGSCVIISCNPLCGMNSLRWTGKILHEHLLAFVLYTLPETTSSHKKNDGWKTFAGFLLGCFTPCKFYGV